MTKGKRKRGANIVKQSSYRTKAFLRYLQNSDEELNWSVGEDGGLVNDDECVIDQSKLEERLSDPKIFKWT